nr:MAG TPA: hypothetical protein [Caudoviricetes sp.]
MKQTRKFDVVFNDSLDSSCKGFSESYEDCLDYIKAYNGTSYSYFEDYKGGTVSIVDSETREEVYSEPVK